MPAPLLLFALTLAPPDVVSVSDDVVVPAAKAKAEAENLAAFGVLLQDAVMPLYADLAPPEVQSAILPGGDAVFLLTLPPTWRDDTTVVAPDNPERGGCPYWRAGEWDRAKMRANAGGTAEACARCHGGADDAGGTLEDLKRLGNGRRLNFGDVASADERPPAPTPLELANALATVLTKYAANLDVPTDGRVSIGVTLKAAAPATPHASDMPGDAEGIEAVAEAEALESEADLLFARQGRSKDALTRYQGAAMRISSPVWDRSAVRPYTPENAAALFRRRLPRPSATALARLLEKAAVAAPPPGPNNVQIGLPAEEWNRRVSAELYRLLASPDPAAVGHPARLAVSGRVDGSGEFFMDLSEASGARLSDPSDAPAAPDEDR